MDLDWRAYAQHAEEMFDRFGIIPLTTRVEGDLAQIIDNLILKALLEKREEVTLLIDSTGGESIMGAAIADRIRIARGFGLRIVGRVSGKAQSAAAVILQACSWRVCAPDGTLLFHWGRHTLFNQDLHCLATDGDAIIQEIRGSLEQAIQQLLSHSRLTREEAITLLGSERILYSQQALTMGLIDEILPWEPQVP